MKVLPDHVPYNEEAEEAVIGSLLINPDCKYELQAFLAPDDFYDERKQTILHAAYNLDGNLDFTTLSDAVGYAPYLASLISKVPTAMHAVHYGRIVKRDSIRRQLIAAGGEIAGTAWQSTDIAEMLAYADRVLSEIDTGTSGDVSLEQAVNEYYDVIEEWAKNPIKDGEVRGLSTGFKDLDSILGGIDPGELVIICGRPSMGKSSIAFDIARRVGASGKNVLIFSLEMTRQSVIQRWISALSGVSTQDIKCGRGNMSAYIDAMGKLTTNGPLWIDDTPGLTATQIKAIAHRRNRKEKIDLVVVDHAGLMNGDALQNENTATKEGRKSRLIKELAKELGCPAILLVQLSRAVEGRMNKRPTMADLRNTGEHEENADKILYVYREEYYDPSNEFKRGIAELGTIKNRNGALGIAELKFEPEYQRWSGAVITKKLIDEEVL